MAWGQEQMDEWKVGAATKIITDVYQLDPLQQESVKQYFSEVFMEQTAVETEGITKPPVFESVSLINESDGSVKTNNFVSVADDQGAYHKIDTTKASEDLTSEQYGQFAVNLARVASGDVKNDGELELFNKIKSGVQPFIQRIKDAGIGGVIFVGVAGLGLGGLIYWMTKGKKREASKA